MIRFLRNFDGEMFLQAHELGVTDEQRGLIRVDVATREWWVKMQAK